MTQQSNRSKDVDLASVANVFDLETDNPALQRAYASVVRQLKTGVASAAFQS